MLVSSTAMADDKDRDFSLHNYLLKQDERDASQYLDQRDKDYIKYREEQLRREKNRIEDEKRDLYRSEKERERGQIRSSPLSVIIKRVPLKPCKVILMDNNSFLALGCDVKGDMLYYKDEEGNIHKIPLKGVKQVED